MLMNAMISTDSTAVVCAERSVEFLCNPLSYQYSQLS